LATPITRERAERIARAHACERCGEYSFKRVIVKPAPASLRDELGAVWVATKTCGVCGLHQELGLDEDGDVVYVS
jgi:transcription elongation factor Elf1